MAETASLAAVRKVADLRARVARMRAGGEAIALVPTMGALHAGHGALIEAARQSASRVVVSIFVNPTQFGAGEDFAAYPRDEAADAAFLARARADLLYAPGVEEMYPDGFATSVHVATLSEDFEGAFRPGHFDGVATVVAKLFAQALPDVAVFGEKDWQQLCVIRRMARDLDLPVKILAVPTAREADGLALSSRNAYLSPQERRIAPALHAALRTAAGGIRGGAPAGAACAAARDAVLAAGFQAVDYLACVEAETLGPFAPSRPARLIAAARLGRTRLIDNIGL